jgi:hypothetical protein
MARIGCLCEAFFVLFVAVSVALVAATACIGGIILGTVALWLTLEDHGLTPPHWTPLGALQGIATALVLLPHIHRPLQR